MANEYIVNGLVARDKIAMDIKYRELSHDALLKLCDNPQIKAAFIGSSFTQKCPKLMWNREYLDRLSYAVVAESFNREYLLYLEEVAEFVSKKTFEKFIIVKLDSMMTYKKYITVKLVPMMTFKNLIIADLIIGFIIIAEIVIFI
jgi:hypothetical protein